MRAEAGEARIFPAFTLRDNVAHADEEFAVQIADAPAPFSGHVRDALETLRQG